MDIDNSATFEALRLQLAAVKQHFIHVLILEARGDKNNSASINNIDSVDLPSAMQMVEHLVSTSEIFGLFDNPDHLLQAMPMPGFSNSEILASECRLEEAIGRAIRHCLQVTTKETVYSLMSKSIAPRSSYLDRLAAWEKKPEPEYVDHLSLTAEQSWWIDTVFANLMVIIDQGMVHAFAYRHIGDPESAAAAWEVSGAAMMQATGLTKCLAARGLAANPSRIPKMAGAVALPPFSIDPKLAKVADRSLAEHYVDVCGQCEQVLDGTEFGPLVAKAKAYFEAAAIWNNGDRLPNIPNPCRDFERTLAVYVRSDNLGQTA